MRRLLASTVPLWLPLLGISGCRFDHLKRDLERMDAFGQLRGEVRVPAWKGEPIVAMALRVPPQLRGVVEVAGQQLLASPGAFSFRLPPGHYLAGAFLDENRNQRYDEGEPGRFGAHPVRVAAGDEPAPQRVVIEGPLHGTLATRLLGVADERLFVVGEQVPLSHRRFGRREATIGVWRPLRAMERYPAGLFVLSPPRRERTPVVLIHGLGGYAQEFGPLIEALDRERFEPWLFQYPSGLPLDVSAELLRRSVRQMAVLHGARPVCLVAHSMGGVVARRALNDAQFAARVAGFTSIASPLGGVLSAERGVRMAPTVVPAWRDLAPDSPFIRQLYEHELPSHLDYQLLFTYSADSGRDSTVPLESQLRPEAQEEARVVRGYAAGHGQVLALGVVLRQIKRGLERCARRAGAGSAENERRPTAEHRSRRAATASAQRPRPRAHRPATAP